MRLLRFLVFAAALSAAGCSEPVFSLPTSADSTTTDSTSSTSTTSTETYAATLEAGTSRFYSFRVSSDSTVTVTLQSLLRYDADVDARLELALGRPTGEACVPQATVLTGPGGEPQLSGEVTAGIHCVRITDPGVLIEAVDFTIAIDHR